MLKNTIVKLCFRYFGNSSYTSFSCSFLYIMTEEEVIKCWDKFTMTCYLLLVSFYQNTQGMNKKQAKEKALKDTENAPIFLK